MREGYWIYQVGRLIDTPGIVNENDIGTMLTACETSRVTSISSEYPFFSSSL